MKFVNLTPIDITVILGEELYANRKTFFKSGTVARVSQESTVDFTVDGINISNVKFGPVVGLPQSVDGVIYIVSAMVKNAVTNRDDCVSPGELARDNCGNVIGCKGFFC